MWRSAGSQLQSWDCRAWFVKSKTSKLPLIYLVRGYLGCNLPALSRPGTGATHWEFDRTLTVGLLIAKRSSWALLSRKRTVKWCHTRTLQGYSRRPRWIYKRWVVLTDTAEYRSAHLSCEELKCRRAKDTTPLDANYQKSACVCLFVQETPRFSVCHTWVSGRFCFESMVWNLISDGWLIFLLFLNKCLLWARHSQIKD